VDVCQVTAGEEDCPIFFDQQAYSGLMTKEELEAAIKLDNLWSGRSTLVLAIGILGEYVALPFLKGGHKLAKTFFAVLVVAGIVGEYEFSSFISQHAEDLQRISDKELTAAIDTAGKAVERASKSDEHAKQLDIDLEAEKQKTARIQGEAYAARLALENRVHTQGPRYFLLRTAASMLSTEWSQFAGQKAALLVCGLYKTDRETLETWGTLANTLGLETVAGVKGAGWKLVRPDPMWNRCGLSMQGIAVMVSSESPRSTRDAATALSTGLLSVLPPYNNNPSVIDPAFVRLIIGNGIVLDKDDPERLTVESPDTVVVFIGEHPPL
jgi:hypothetical protein